MHKDERIIAVDFDGTLCVNDWPRIGAPRKAVIDYVLYQQKTGAKIILWTNRVGDKLDEAVEWCKDNGITFDAVNANLPSSIRAFNNDSRKIYATEYLDDKSVTPEDAERRMGHYSRRRVTFR